MNDLYHKTPGDFSGVLIMPFTWQAILLFTVIFIVAFALIWLIVRQIDRRNVKQINESYLILIPNKK